MRSLMLRHLHAACPKPLRETVQAEPDRMESTGVIYNMRRPTLGCACMVLVPKPTKMPVGLRVDLTPLKKNRCVVGDLVFSRL